MVTVTRLYFLAPQNHCRWWLQPRNQKMLISWEKSFDQPRQHIEKQRNYFANKAMVFPVVMYECWELDYKESWALKNWCFSTVVLQKTLESPLDCKEVQPGNPKGNSVLNIHWKEWCWSWNFHLMRRTDSLENTLMLGKIEGRRRRGWQRLK